MIGLSLFNTKYVQLIHVSAQNVLLLLAKGKMVLQEPNQTER